MRSWIIVVFIVLTLSVFYMSLLPNVVETFATVDLNTAKAQRQMLQFEGERRYNDFARLQGTNTNIPADQANDLLNNAVPTPSSNTSSLMSLLGFTEFGSVDDGSGKQGNGVEQTGMIREKINFCENMSAADCNNMDDPRFAECGICHKDGVNSMGKRHRGGMYISSDDQIRANAVSSANGNVKALYKPTVGTCEPKNFTVVKDTCVQKERHFQCQTAGAATSSNECGQCYGSAPAGTSGLLYYGPKGGAANRSVVYLNVSHPGGHTGQGVGMTITHADGTVDKIATSKAKLYDPKRIPLNIQEGDSLSIVMYGAPAVWCAWFSNAEETRAVSMDIGVKNMSPSKGLSIAGDKYSLIVKKAFTAAGLSAESLLQNVPNTVLWYRRRDDILPGMIVSATYGPMDVTSKIKEAASGNQNIPASNNYFEQDPQYGTQKWVTIKMDNGRTVATREGDSIPIAKVRSVITMQVTMPATLQEPLYAEDKELCPTGPLVTTEAGAGIMGANSCFNPDGTFNPSLYCIQELFQSSGGTPDGKAFPNTAAAALAIVGKDSATGKPSLDATVQKFNNRSNIAIYGVDSNGAPQTFAAIKAAALEMLGITMNNPCDGPMAQTGPHTQDCLDYLWRTSGNSGQDIVQGDPTKLPYAYCGSYGTSAPLNPDGSVNQNNVMAANEFGAIPNVRAYYQSLYNRAADSSDFDNQSEAMRACFNIKIGAPPVNPDTCPSVPKMTGPREIPGLYAWYDASDPLDTGLPPTNMSSISIWKDRSGNNNDMIGQIPAKFEQNTRNNLGTLAFSNSWYAQTRNVPYPLDVFVVVKLNSLSRANDVIGVGNTNVDNFNSLTFGEYKSGYWHNGSSYFQRTGNAVANTKETSSDFVLMQWYIANNRFFINRNGANIMFTNAYSWSTSSTYLNIGNRFMRPAGNLLDGKVAEVIVFNNELSKDNRQKVEGYLSKKWGLTADLPADHPYKS